MSLERTTWFLFGRKERGNILSGEDRQTFLMGEIDTYWFLSFCSYSENTQAAKSYSGTDFHFCHLSFDLPQKITGYIVDNH